MDLESESSALESVEDNEVNQDSVSHADSNLIKNNGSFAYETEKLSSGQEIDANSVLPNNSHDKGVAQPLNSPQLGFESPGGASPPTRKGYGLKKWRRIKRDFVKDGSAGVDSSKVLKRGLSSSANPTKSSHLSLAEVKQNSEGSVGSANALRTAGAVDGFAIHGSSSDSRFAVASAFAAGTDSENSEDRSSKSSTAASAPKVRHDRPAVLGHVRDKNRMKNLSGKTASNSAQRVQQGKGLVESSKKPRGDRVKIEKENSHSSMESDSRSSNFVFMQTPLSATGNGKPSGISMNYDGENSDDAHASEQQFSEDVQTGHRKHVGDAEDLSQDDLAEELSWEVKEEKDENHQSSTSRDPLVESILALQSVQEALENEVRLLGEIGKEPVSQCDDSIEDNNVSEGTNIADPEVTEPGSYDQFSSENIRQSASNALEMQILSLTQCVKYLESKLEDANAILKVKEARVEELEASLNPNKSLKEESASNGDLQQLNLGESEIELEDIFKQKIEAEIEYLTLTRTIQKLRVAATNGVTLFEEQESLVGEQAKMLDKLEETESKAATIKKQAEELEKYCGEILETEKVLKMQRKVCKISSCFFIQLILLLLVIWLYLSQLAPHSAVVIPT